jgi:hypothetical protein
MKSVKASVTILLLLCFLIGVAAGVFVDRRFLPGKRSEHSGRGSSWREDQLRSFSRDLNLDAAQRTKLKQILEEAHPKFLRFFEEVRPKYQLLKLSVRKKIRAILTVEQGARFDARCEEMDRKREGYYTK